MKISIAMATYNGAKYIQEQLQSFVDQTRLPDELIVTDDCSTDETEAIVRDFARTAPFKVELHRNERNLGYCGNFNAALMKTTGDLVFLSDQDDVWHPRKIEHMVDVAERYPDVLLVMNDAAFTDDKLNEVGLTKLGQIRSSGFSMETFVMGCCCAVRRTLLEICMPIPEGFKGHDDWLVQFADGLNARFVEPAVLQYYRRHESNESQFIVNRTKKVTRNAARLQSLKNLLKRQAVAKLNAELAQSKMVADAVVGAKSVNPERYYDLLQSMERRYRRQVATTEQRLAVVEKSFLPRVVGVSGLLMRSGYSDTKGFRSVIRDIVG